MQHISSFRRVILFYEPSTSCPSSIENLTATAALWVPIEFHLHHVVRQKASHRLAMGKRSGLRGDTSIRSASSGKRLLRTQGRLAAAFVSYRPIVGHSFSLIGGQAFSLEWGPPVFGAIGGQRFSPDREPGVSAR